MKHWTEMTVPEMVKDFRNLFSSAELREERAGSEKAIEEFERTIGLHRRRIEAIDILLREHGGDADGNDL